MRRQREDIQREAIDALHAEAAFGRKLAAGITPNTTLADVNDAMESPEGAAIQDRRHSACLALQKLADDHSIKVDMTC